MKCWSCGKAVELPPLKQLGFKEVCSSCHAYLHSCKGCRFHEEGRPNECQIPGTEQIRDREGGNFCDEFAPIQVKEEKKENKDQAKKKFDDLFK